MKKLSVWLLTLALLLLLAGCGKSEAVKSAEGLINAIGEVTLDSNSAILKAENAVAALSEEDMADLEGAETLQAARDSYDALVIIDLIDNMGEVTLSSEDTLQAIRERYDAASPEAQAAVTNYAVLQEAERQYQTLADAAAEALRIAGEDALGRMRLAEDKVRDAVFYYPQHFPKYIDDRNMPFATWGRTTPRSGCGSAMTTWAATGSSGSSCTTRSTARPTAARSTILTLNGTTRATWCGSTSTIPPRLRICGCLPPLPSRMRR